MGRKSKFKINDKLEYVLKFIYGENSINHIAKPIGVNPKTLSNWILNYQLLRIDGLNAKSKNIFIQKKLRIWL